MNLAVDEYGNPFILIRDQDKKKRMNASEALEYNIMAAHEIGQRLKTSLGPNGMDKILVTKGNDQIVTNDGATILEFLNPDHPCARILVQLSKSQDTEYGDGTTGVVVLASTLLYKALPLLSRGLDPLVVADGYECAVEVACARLEEIASTSQTLSDEMLIHAAETALDSKIVSAGKNKLAKICVDAVKAIMDPQTRDVNLDMIKLLKSVGGSINDAELVHGVIINKDFSHSHMAKELTNVKVAILTFALEPEKPKTKHSLEINSVESYNQLANMEQAYFTKQIDALKAAGVQCVICQWGFDDEANFALQQAGISAVRWVGGVEIELLAKISGAKIIARAEDISADKLGTFVSAKEVHNGTSNTKMCTFMGICNLALTIVVRGASKQTTDEAHRSIWDAICCVRNLLKDPRIIPGGGASEIAASIAVLNSTSNIDNERVYAFRAFSESLSALPESIATNCGFNGMSVVANIRSQQVLSNNANLGVSVQDEHEPADMMKQGVVESLIAKIGQFSLATQVAKMILKIDDVIKPQEGMI